MQRRYFSISALALSLFAGSVFAQTKWDLLVLTLRLTSIQKT